MGDIRVITFTESFSGRDYETMTALCEQVNYDGDKKYFGSLLLICHIISPVYNIKCIYINTWLILQNKYISLN